jgi:hypothetical protein
MAWCAGDYHCELFVDLRFKISTVTYTEEGSLAETSFRA